MSQNAVNFAITLNSFDSSSRRTEKTNKKISQNRDESVIAISIGIFFTIFNKTRILGLVGPNKLLQERRRGGIVADNIIGLIISLTMWTYAE